MEALLTETAVSWVFSQASTGDELMGNDEKLRGLKKGRASRLAGFAGLATSVAGNALRAAGALAKTGSVQKAGEELHRRTAENLAASLGDMKGLPMKVGQMLSYIDEFVPSKHRALYRETLSKLQSKTRPMDWESIEGTLVTSLGHPVDQVFAEFNKEPIAAASIGQVYEARLHDGMKVAVKVQYPGIAEAIANDLNNVGSIMKPLLAVIPKVSVDAAATDLQERLLSECDYVSEAQAQEHFYGLYEYDEKIVIPKVIHELSSPQVLVTEFIDGLTFQELFEQRTAEQRSEVGATIHRFVYQSLYKHGVLNTDPHPGNYIFLDDGRVAFLDFGSVQFYSESLRKAFCELTMATIHGVRGQNLRSLVDATFGIPAHVELDEAFWLVAEDFIHLCAEPTCAAQPYTYDPSLVRRISAKTAEIRTMLMQRTLKTGIWTPTQKGMVFMYRINFGLNSLLAELGACGNWQAHAQTACAVGTRYINHSFSEPTSELSSSVIHSMASIDALQSEQIP